MNAPLSPTPLTDVHRTRFYELPTDASKHDCITLALSAISALEDTERSLAERDARIAELVENGNRLVAAADGWKADAIEWQEKHAAAEARNAELVGALSFAELRATNVSRALRWHPRGLQEWSLSDWGVAAAGEMGEALNIIKKLNRERDGITGNSVTANVLKEQLSDEIADVVIYLDILAASEGIDLAQAIASKFNRTSEKVGFPERLSAALTEQRGGKHE